MKIIGFSRFYPSTHTRKCEPTYFVEKILNGLGIDYLSPTYLNHLRKLNPDRLQLAEDLWGELVEVPSSEVQTKFTTIRETDTWKQGDMFSPRVWSGAPYRTKRVRFWMDLELQKVNKFAIDKEQFIRLENEPSIELYLEALANHDGLHLQDWLSWFKYPNQFHGQQLVFNGK